MKSILNWLWHKIKIRAKRSWGNNKKIHKRALKKSENRWRLFIAVLLYVIISWALIQDDIKLGLSFLFAGAIAIYAGHIYKDRQAMGLVLVGVALASTLIPSFFPSVKESFKQGDYIGMLILILFGIFFWYFSGQLKKGEIPDFGDKPDSKPRTRKRRKYR